MNIPRILHQTWKSESPPRQFKKLMNTWKKYHPLWKHILWTDDMNRAFIKDKFPDFIATYDGYKENIQRVDAVRYFILRHYGGVYIDLDFECLRNIEPLLENESCVLGKESDEHCCIHNKEMIISNAFMACTPNHAFIKMLCEELYNRNSTLQHRNNNILESTGPFMVTRVFQQFQEKEPPTILASSVLFPLTKNEVMLLLSSGKKITKEIQEKQNNAYGIHYYSGTWWKYRHNVLTRVASFLQHYSKLFRALK